jgi:hypothetical protein
MVSQEMHQSWASLIELGIAIFLLERQLGVACLMPVSLALGILIAQLTGTTSLNRPQVALWGLYSFPAGWEEPRVHGLPSPRKDSVLPNPSLLP